VPPAHIQLAYADAKLHNDRSTTPIQDICEGFPGRSYATCWVIECLTWFTEEFGIYLNYVRKLGFEETPDYDFLRELFTKVLKNMGEVEDGIYDWHLLAQNGKTWEVCHVTATLRLLLILEASSRVRVSLTRQTKEAQGVPAESATDRLNSNFLLLASLHPPPCFPKMAPNKEPRSKTRLLV